MPTVYQYTAEQCPAIQDPGDPILISVGGASTPITTRAESILTGDGALTGTGRLNRNAGRLDNLGRYGGGRLGAILWGLTITAGPEDGQITIAAGQAGIDSGAELAEDYVQELADGLVSRVWLSGGGTVNVVTASSPDPLDPPDDASAWTYLGAASMSTTLQWVDESGVLRAGRGGIVTRRTADVGPPGDTPPSWAQFLHQSADGLYLWTGTEYRKLQPADPVRDRISAGTTVFIGADYQQYVFDRLVIEGRLVVEGRLRVEG